MLRALAALVIAASGLAPLAARAAEVPSPLPVWHIGPYFGAAGNSPGGGDWGGVPDRDHLFLGVRGTAPVVRWRQLSLAYAAELTPMLIVSNNPDYRTITVIRGGVPDSSRCPDGSSPVYRAGFSPTRAGALLRPGRDVQFFGAISDAGLVWFPHDVPVANSRAVNLPRPRWGSGCCWGTRSGGGASATSSTTSPNSWTAKAGTERHVFYFGWEAAIGH
jgi:hypothetical protein